jgi:DnaJ-domain-containing protein 1
LRLQQTELSQQWAERGRQLAKRDGLALLEVKALLFLASLHVADSDSELTLLEEARRLAEDDSDSWLMAEAYLANGQTLLEQARGRAEELSKRSGLSMTTIRQLQQPTGGSTFSGGLSRHRCKRAPGTAAHADSDVPYQGMEFDPMVLAEQVALNDQLKKELLYCDAHLGEWSHFELLGVSLNASTEDIRKAYFSASKRFHPDRFFRKNTGSYQERIGRVFEAIKRAYNVLSDETERAAYEATLEWPLPEGVMAELAANRDRRQRGLDLLRAAAVCGRLSARATIVAEANAALTAAGAAAV